MHVRTDFLYKKIRHSFKKFLILCIFFPFLAVYTASIYAVQTGDEEAIKDIERKKFKIEEKLREKEKKEKEAEEKLEEKKILLPEEGEVRFLIKEIIVQNSELLSKKERNTLMAPFLNRRNSYNDINILVSRITNVLVEKGYITTRVKVPLDQDLKSGKLILTILNGYIEVIVPDEDTIRRKMQVYFAFPFFKDKLLNINDLDYGIEQMNRLESNSATMKILPGEALGASKIIIYNDPGYLLNLETGIDNLGQKKTGEYKRKISAGFDNLISINDNSMFTYTDGTNSDTDRKYNRCYTMYLAFPVGYWTISATYSRSEFMQHVSGLNTEYKFSGKDTSKILSVERLIWRQKLDRIKMKTSLTLKNKEIFIEDNKIDTSSRKLTIADLGINYSSFILGGYFYVKAEYNKGVDAFDSKKDSSGMAEDIPRAQFNKYKMDLAWNKPFNFFGQNFGYNITCNGQYGMESLYNSEQISIGDIYTVRGFKNYSAAGDRGYFIRNEFSISDFSRFLTYLSGVKIYAGYDYGYVIQKTGKSANNGQGEAALSGISSGFNYSSRLFNANFTYARRLRSPGFINEDRYVIYFIFSINLTNMFDETWKIVTIKENKKE